MDVPMLAWAAFAAFVIVMISLDLFVFGRRPHKVTMREAGIWSAIWLTMGLSFTGVVWWWQGAERGGEYLAGYLIEKSLSVDNIFVFAMIFTYFAVPTAYRNRVLMWGVLGALVLRAILIFAGAALLKEFHFVIYLFGGLLIATGIKMALHKGGEIHPERNPVLRLVNRFVPSTTEYDGHRVFTRENGRRLATPLFAVFVVVATTDVMFAIDSIPAIFAVTDEPFIVLTANVFALLGLRALYFLLDGMMHRFIYLQPALAAILVFVGCKMILVDVYKVPIWASLMVIASLVAVGVVASLRATRSSGDEDPPEPPVDDGGDGGASVETRPLEVVR
jgi:tellurite resistance protein TerC